MADGTVHQQIAADVLNEFNMPLSVSAMSKLQQFPMLQKLAFNGHLNDLKANFHGLKEFNIQMDLYSSTNPILTAAWKAIKHLAPQNLQIAGLLFTDPSLGTVGNLFQSIHNFGRVFSVLPTPLPSLESIAKKAT